MMLLYNTNNSITEPDYPYKAASLTYVASLGYRKNKLPFPCLLHVLKAGSVVKHGDNRSKDDYISVQLAQKSQ